MAQKCSNLINLVLPLALVAPGGCGVPMDESSEEVTEIDQDELRRAVPANNIPIPASLNADRIGSVVSSCTTKGATGMAKLRYRATRGRDTDSVLLTFVAHNGYVGVSHERNGKKLGIHIMDGFTKKEVGSDSFAKAGRERAAAYLFAELASVGVMEKLPEAARCLGNTPGGELVRDGETYGLYGWCNFFYDSLDAAYAVTAVAVAAACCTTGVACIGCSVAAGAFTQVVTKTNEALEARDCRDRDEEQRRMQEELDEQRERRQMQEEIREMQEQIKDLERRVKEEEEKKKVEEEERATMGT
jgi:hypothetical protein